MSKEPSMGFFTDRCNQTIALPVNKIHVRQDWIYPHNKLNPIHRADQLAYKYIGLEQLIFAGGHS
jgi:hypothetical protein